MADRGDSPDGIQSCLDRLRAGDDAAGRELVDCACARLSKLCRTMLRGYPCVRRWEDTDDVTQNVAMRLWASLREVRPATTTAFFGLAALHARRELIDLARRFAGPQGLGARHDSGDTPDPGDSTYEPARLAAWTEFHEAVAALADDERILFDVLWYQGMTLPEAAALLDVPERTLRRRWRAARARVYAKLNGPPPDGPTSDA